MRIQIRTLQVPTAWGTGAFMPLPAAVSTAEFNGQNIVTGYPGTCAVPAPRPPALRDSDLGGFFNQPSDVAPNYILPSIYVARVNNTMHFPGNISRTNVSPVAATAIGATARAAWTKPVIGGDKVTRSVRPFTQWRTWSGGASN
jgi:hypothetical protein